MAQLKKQFSAPTPRITDCSKVFWRLETAEPIPGNPIPNNISEDGSGTQDPIGARVR